MGKRPAPSPPTPLPRSTGGEGSFPHKLLPTWLAAAVPAEAVQLPVFRRDQDLRSAVAVQVSQDRLADAPAERHRPQEPRLAAALAQGVQFAVVAAEQHLRPAIGVQVGGTVRKEELKVEQKGDVDVRHKDKRS